jgi:hypothetical protein
VFRRIGGGRERLLLPEAIRPVFQYRGVKSAWGVRGRDKEECDERDDVAET